MFTALYILALSALPRFPDGPIEYIFPPLILQTHPSSPPPQEAKKTAVMRIVVFHISFYLQTLGQLLPVPPGPE